MRCAGLDLSAAMRLATINPAWLLGVGGPGGRGEVRVGAVADLIVFALDPVTRDLDVQMTIVGGRLCFARPNRTVKPHDIEWRRTPRDRVGSSDRCCRSPLGVLRTPGKEC